jgi:hypothetical protein
MEKNTGNADDKILQECIPALKIEIRATSEMGGLLEENGIGTKYLTCIYGNLLRLLSAMATRELEDAGDTSFWAEKMAFMMGMYDVDRSGDTERIRIRGSVRLAAREIRLMSAIGWVKIVGKQGQGRTQTAKGFCQGSDESHWVIGGVVGVELVGDAGDDGRVEKLKGGICIGVGGNGRRVLVGVEENAMPER